ncbi:MAG: DUF1476 domain-containing protein [Inquilinus sp.]|nr:DUF1476 domain-containing protein [Inquilinus sp.]
MSGFDDREKAFELKFKHDQDTLFRIQNRRNKLLGQWAAEVMGLPEGEVDAYVKAVILSEMDQPGDDDVHDKVYADLHAKGIDLSDHRLRKRMDELLQVAHDQVMEED